MAVTGEWMVVVVVVCGMWACWTEQVLIATLRRYGIRFDRSHSGWCLLCRCGTLSICAASWVRPAQSRHVEILQVRPPTHDVHTWHLIHNNSSSPRLAGSWERKRWEVKNCHDPNDEGDSMGCKSDSVCWINE
jgi:hypothetical protein